MTGSGTIGDPYIISSKADLQAIDSDMTAYYELANDIDCAHAWTTLSSDDFTGHLDGKGFKITHMDINAPAGSWNLGLFAIISETGTIENLGIEDSTLIGESSIGAFAGYVLDGAGWPPVEYTGHVSNCYAKNITIYAIEGYAGSLFGFTFLHDGHIGIYDCWSEDCIIYDGPASDGNLGGFTCLADTGIIERCYVKNVTIYTGSGVSGQCYGGFVGTTSGSTDDALPGTIQECWCSGSVEGGYMVGGFVGDQGFNYKSLIQNCYSRCSVHQLAPDAYLAGGFVGLQRAFTGGSPSGGIILNSYSTGAIVVDLPDDLVVGFGTETFFAAWSEITDCYTDMDTNGADTPGDATGKTTAEMQVVTTFPTWDFSTVWLIVPTCNDGYPCLINATPSCAVVVRVRTLPVVTLAALRSDTISLVRRPRFS